MLTFCNNMFSHTRLCRGDEWLALTFLYTNSSRATFPDNKIIDFKPYVLVCHSHASVCTIMALVCNRMYSYIFICYSYVIHSTRVVF